MARVAVIGAGAIGALFGGQLHVSGHDVLFCSRRPFSRLHIDSDVVPIDSAVRVVTSASDVPVGWPPADWVLVAVKVHHLRAVGDWLSRLVGPGTRVVACQNGLDARAALLAAGCRAPVVDTAVYAGADCSEPGRVRHTGGLRLLVADDPVGRELRRLFAGTAVRVEATEDLLAARWRKLLVNCAANGITALTRRPLGVFSRPEAIEAARALLDEGRHVAEANGVVLSVADVEGILEDLGSVLAADVAPSMLQDRLAARPTEHDALYGAVVRAAAERGTAAPLHHLVQHLLAAGDPGTGR